jgi:hypothetical protein
MNKLAATGTVLVMWAMCMVAAPFVVTGVVLRALREIWW